MAVEHLPGDWVDAMDPLARARSYWLVTTNATAGPHVAPVWGVVLDGALHVYSERATVKAHNLADDPRVVIHTGDTSEVTIVYGTLDDLGSPRDHPRVLDALSVKYDGPGEGDYLPSAPDSSYDVLYRLRPARALSWSLDDFAGTQRRWRA